MAVYNRVYTNEKWEKVNKYNKDLLGDYMLQIKAEGKSPGSQKQYYNDARIMLIYVLEELDNKPIYKLSRKAFRNYVLWMKENGMSPARINRMLSTSRNLLNFGLEDEDYEEDFEESKTNPSRIKGIKKEKVRDIVFLSDNEIVVIYNRLKAEKEYSQALLCAFMYDSCSRRNEAYQVKRSDISLESNICKSPVRGKRGKVYRPIYNDLTKEAYKLLEENRTDTNDSLWLTRSGTPASYESLYSWVVSWRKILEEETGVYKEFNPHSFRHSCANNLENGTHYLCLKTGKKFDLMQIQKLMNHSDLSTTQGYLEDRTEDELLEAFCM